MGSKNIPTSRHVARERCDSSSSGRVDTDDRVYETSNPFAILADEDNANIQKILNEIEPLPSIKKSSFASILKSPKPKPKSPKSLNTASGSNLNTSPFPNLDSFDPENYNLSTTRIFNNSKIVKDNEPKPKLDLDKRNVLKQKLSERINNPNSNTQNNPIDLLEYYSKYSSNDSLNNFFSNTDSLFWLSISKLILEFLGLEEKSLKSFCSLGWKILKKVAIHYNFDL